MTAGAKSLGRWAAGLGAAWLLLAGAPAQAKLGGLGGVGQLPNAQLPGGLGAPRLGGLPGEVDRLGRQAVGGALRAPARLGGLVGRSDGALEADPQGWPVVRGEIVALDLDADVRARAVEAGYALLREERFEDLDLTATVFAPPRRMSLRRAAERLQAWDPGAEIDYNHVHAPSGEVEGMASTATMTGASTASQSGGVRLGLIDTGVDADHPALSGARISQRGFAGAAPAGAHGTAVASLMVGRAGAFSGAEPGGELLAADIYGGQATGGSSTGLAQALSWMTGQGARVVNVSLVGPRNALVERAVAQAQARGVTVVAAVGNEGPAAPPLYPASYSGVVGVTAVNARDQVLPESARGPQVDVAAPGADMAAAGVDGGYVTVRGTSFAAPLVAGLLARGGGGDAAVLALGRSATDLGARGRDPVSGAGLVGAELRVAPQVVGARGRLSR